MAGLETFPTIANDGVPVPIFDFNVLYADFSEDNITSSQDAKRIDHVSSNGVLLSHLPVEAYSQPALDAEQTNYTQQTAFLARIGNQFNDIDLSDIDVEALPAILPSPLEVTNAAGRAPEYIPYQNDNDFEYNTAAPQLIDEGYASLGWTSILESGQKGPENNNLDVEGPLLQNWNDFDQIFSQIEQEDFDIFNQTPFVAQQLTPPPDKNLDKGFTHPQTLDVVEQRLGNFNGNLRAARQATPPPIGAKPVGIQKKKGGKKEKPPKPKSGQLLFMEPETANIVTKYQSAGFTKEERLHHSQGSKEQLKRWGIRADTHDMWLQDGSWPCRIDFFKRTGHLPAHVADIDGVWYVAKQVSSYKAQE